jgi:hypothetical protein
MFAGKRLIVVTCVVAMLSVLVTVMFSRPAATRIEVRRGDPQLFVDDYLIDQQEGLCRTLIQPNKDNGGSDPLLSFKDLQIEEVGTLEANGTILFDPKINKYVMYALAFRATHTDWLKVQLYRFTSPDGLAWKPGEDGTPQPVFPLQADDLRDPESGQRATNIDLCSFYYDSHDNQTPYKAWIWFSNMGDREGLYYVSSPDGIRWTRGRQVLGLRDFSIRQGPWDLYGPGDVSIFSHDPVSDRFLALIKLVNRKAIGPNNRQRSRAFLYVDRLDQRIDPSRLTRVDLVPPVAASGGDLPWDEYYASTAWRCGSLWLGGLKIWHGGGNYTYSAAGCAFLKLISSRDGLHWHKVHFPNDENTLEVWIPNGPEGGNANRNDGGYITEFSQGPLRIGDEWIYYYGSSSQGKNHAKGIRLAGGGIFRGRIRPEALVSVDGGWLLTKPFKLPGNDLTVNSVGAVTVELIRGGKTAVRCQLEGDHLAQPVLFEGKSAGETAGTDEIGLRFAVAPGAHLYSFTVR